MVNVHMEPGDEIALTTPNGTIFIGADKEGGSTIVTVAHNQGYKLFPNVSQKLGDEEQQQYVHVHIELEEA